MYFNSNKRHVNSDMLSEYNRTQSKTMTDQTQSKTMTDLKQSETMTDQTQSKTMTDQIQSTNKKKRKTAMGLLKTIDATFETHIWSLNGNIRAFEEWFKDSIKKLCENPKPNEVDWLINLKRFNDDDFTCFAHWSPDVKTYEDIRWWIYYNVYTPYLNEIHKQNIIFQEKLETGDITVDTKTSLKSSKQLQTLGYEWKFTKPERKKTLSERYNIRIIKDKIKRKAFWITKIRQGYPGILYSLYLCMINTHHEMKYKVNSDDVYSPNHHKMYKRVDNIKVQPIKAKELLKYNRHCYFDNDGRVFDFDNDSEEEYESEDDDDDDDESEDDDDESEDDDDESKDYDCKGYLEHKFKKDAVKYVINSYSEQHLNENQMFGYKGDNEYWKRGLADSNKVRCK